MNTDITQSVLNEKVVMGLLDYMSAEELTGLILESEQGLANTFHIAKDNIKAKEFKKAKNAIHTLRGECSMLGAYKLTLVLQEVEQLINKNQTPDNSHGFFRYESLFDEFKNAISRFIDNE